MEKFIMQLNFLLWYVDDFSYQTYNNSSTIKPYATIKMNV